MDSLSAAVVGMIGLVGFVILLDAMDGWLKRHRQKVKRGERCHMSKEFNQCVAGGGRVITKSLSGDRYLHICYPKGGGASVAGEVKQRVGHRLKKALSGKVD